MSCRLTPSRWLLATILDARGWEVRKESLSMRLDCPARMMGRKGFESPSNWVRV
jgi:hypothetical protein